MAYLAIGRGLTVDFDVGLDELSDLLWLHLVFLEREAPRHNRYIDAEDDGNPEPPISSGFWKAIPLCQKLFKVLHVPVLH